MNHWRLKANFLFWNHEFQILILSLGVVSQSSLNITIQVSQALITKRHMIYALGGLNALVVLVFYRIMISAIIGASLSFVSRQDCNLWDVADGGLFSKLRFSYMPGCTRYLPMPKARWRKTHRNKLENDELGQSQSLKVEFHPGAGKNKRPKSATYSILYNVFYIFYRFCFCWWWSLNKNLLWEWV